MKVDVAIIGAGPSGAMAALQLAGTGLTAAVLEKKRIPRPKACGGAISIGTFEMLQQWFTPSIAARATAVRFYHNYKPPATEMGLGAPIVLIDRKHFDLQLIEAAIKRAGTGITVRDGWPVGGVDETDAGFRIAGPRGEILSARFLIAADGADSRVARWLGMHPISSAGLAIDASVETTAEAIERYRSTVEFNYFCIPAGYGWIFPKRDHLSCGIGSWRKPYPARRDMNAFLQRCFPAGSIRSVRMKAHPVPVWPGYGRISSARACLVGDAAHLVNPITGEGIRFALDSGRLAAETILRLADKREDEKQPPGADRLEPIGCRGYQQRVYQEIGRRFEILRRLALPVFLDAPELFYRKFIREGRDLGITYRNLADKITATSVQPTSSGAVA